MKTNIFVWDRIDCYHIMMDGDKVETIYKGEEPEERELASDRMMSIVSDWVGVDWEFWKIEGLSCMVVATIE